MGGTMNITNTTHANLALRDIGRLDRDIKAEEIILNDAIDKLREEQAAKVAPMIARRKMLADGVLAYIKTNKRTMKELRSLELDYGTIGIKDFPAKLRIMKGFTKDDVAKRIADLKQFAGCVKVRYTLVMNAIKALSLPDEKLQQYGITTSQKKDQPYFTINEAKIEAEDAG